MSIENSSLEAFLQVHQQRVSSALDQWLPQNNTLPERLHEAMRYAVLNGGKRIRPVLTYAAGQALEVPAEQLDGPACAVELIHAYSLVHDDLPSMDNDELRRGKPTCHIAFDEATAVLTGDALQSLAFYILSHDPNMVSDPKLRLRMVELLADASGSRGMAGGQAIDLAYVGRELNLIELENMHIHKTGALIRAAVQLGALSNKDIDPAVLDKLDHYGKCIGLAFQIQDDILDVESDTQTLGKTQGSDVARNKPTYPAIVGLKQAKQMAADLVDQSLESLCTLSHLADPLRWIAQYIIARRY
ncbi:(2E,6E)-farnesyl diphosphate synthase [Kaarinaea lacus]